MMDYSRLMIEHRRPNEKLFLICGIPDFVFYVFVFLLARIFMTSLSCYLLLFSISFTCQCRRVQSLDHLHLPFAWHLRHQPYRSQHYHQLIQTHSSSFVVGVVLHHIQDHQLRLRRQKRGTSCENIMV